MERALITLTPSEAKRLIGKAVAKMEPIKAALKKGIIVICLGTTNAFVAEEILGMKIEKGRFAIGIITSHGTCITNPDYRLKELIIRDGKLTELTIKDVLDELGPNDVFIKGANAIDPYGNAGVFLGSPTGGTLGISIGVLLSRGVKIIIPVSLEKFTPYPIDDLILRLGNRRFNYSMKMPVGMMLLPGEIVTEIEAFKILFECECIPIGGGGINGGERCYLLEGEKLEEVWKEIMKIKGEEKIIVEEE
ncbi:MAG: hypothetical protein NZ922_06860, partial [Candidatus Methanomethyliaceae archaeon]|nr:hypothetical protein [Candidatus Methanomethyliaceae archaeon]MDW7971334.1 hypothetical protein [Nitrososphaerota archaeon]